MVWIQAPKNYERIAPVKENTPKEFTDPVEFNDNSTANVPAVVAEYLVDEYPDVEFTENEDSE